MDTKIIALDFGSTSTQTWAEREVEIFKQLKQSEQTDKKSDFDYSLACVESALKAFNSLLEDGHSNFSINITKNILNRLIDQMPLTCIEDTDDVWEYISKNSESSFYQCKRMASLFKYVFSDGTVKYKDLDRCRGEDIGNEGVLYHSGLIDRIMDEIRPITMPYYPKGRRIKVTCESFLTDPNNGDFDTVGVLYFIDDNSPVPHRLSINRYFKEADGDLVEIDFAEYEKRRNSINSRKGDAK